MAPDPKCAPAPDGGANSITSNASSESDNGFPAWKRALDLSCVAIALPGLVVLTPLIVAAIKLASPGPVLFRQVRVGYRRKPFTMLKFRTMWPDADQTVHQHYMAEVMKSDQPMRKRDEDGDERVYPLGAFLRASGLDELPQFWNVIRGEMSIVGPRPCTEAELAGYEPWQMERFATPPGLTGLWQVSGKNHRSFREMILLDLRYVQTRSLWLDLWIILRTVPVLIGEVLKWMGITSDQKPGSEQAEPAQAQSQRSPLQAWFKVPHTQGHSNLAATAQADQPAHTAQPQPAPEPPRLAPDQQ